MSSTARRIAVWSKANGASTRPTAGSGTPRSSGRGCDDSEGSFPDAQLAAVRRLDHGGNRGHRARGYGARLAGDVGRGLGELLAVGVHREPVALLVDAAIGPGDALNARKDVVARREKFGDLLRRAGRVPGVHSSSSNE